MSLLALLASSGPDVAALRLSPRQVDAVGQGVPGDPAASGQKEKSNLPLALQDASGKPWHR
jgi:hypothetical protein